MTRAAALRSGPGGRVRRAAVGAAAVVAFAAVAAAVRSPSLRSIVPEDAGAYLYVGRLMFDGGLPYVDAIDNKGPLTYALFGLVDRVAGDSALGVRLTLVAFAGVAALGVAGYVGRLAGRAAGLAAGLVFAVVGSGPWQGDSPNTEQYGVAPMAVAWWLSTRAELASAAVAGALVSAATLMNVGFALCALPVAFELLRAQRGRRRAAALAAAVAAGAIVAGAVLAWLAWRGALGAMLRDYVGYGGDALSGTVTATEGFGRRVAVPHLLLVLAGLAGCLAATRSSRYRAAGVGAAVWIVVMLGRAKLSPYDGDLFAHHYYPLTPGIAAGLAVGGASLWSQAGRLARPARAAVIVTLAAFLAGVYLAAPVVRFARLAQERDPRELRAAADYVRAHTRAGDRILVSGFAPQFYWLARRDAASRLFALPRFGVVSRNGNYLTTYRARRLAELLRRPPAAIVVPNGRPDGDVQVALQLLPYRRAKGTCRLSRRETRSCADVWMRKPRPRVRWTPRAIERQLATLKATCWGAPGARTGTGRARDVARGRAPGRAKRQPARRAGRPPAAEAGGCGRGPASGSRPRA